MTYIGLLDMSQKKTNSDLPFSVLPILFHGGGIFFVSFQKYIIVWAKRNFPGQC